MQSRVEYPVVPQPPLQQSMVDLQFGLGPVYNAQYALQASGGNLVQRSVNFAL